MLAEPRRKRKIQYQPAAQNKDWYKAPDHFGAKMMAKMGWTEGSGLGVKQQGNPEYVRVQTKNDNFGIGFDEKSLSKLSAHMETFNSILSSLDVVTCSKSSNSTELSKADRKRKLESGDTSEQFKDFSEIRRVKLCKRRLDNKSLSNKSQKDIDIILGRNLHGSKSAPDLKTLSQSSENESSESSYCSNGESQLETLSKKRRKVSREILPSELEKTDNASEEKLELPVMQYTTSSKSVQDYFAEKMRKLGKLSKKAEETTAKEDRVVEQTEQSDDE